MKNKVKSKLIYSDLKLSDFGKTNNEGYVKGKCRIAYAGKNRNKTNIPKEAFKDAETTLYNTPVVGNWLGDNFGGHDIILETEGNQIIMKDKTEAIGFVPESSEITWEEVVDDNGNIKLYQTCDVILWRGRKPEEVDFIIENGAHHSMEIIVEEGEYDDSDYYNINKFRYHALCVLGKDESDPDKDVEPCFEDSEITTDFSSEFNNTFNEMVNGFNNMKGDDKMTKQLEKENAKLEIKNEELEEKVKSFLKVNKELDKNNDDLANKNKELEAENKELKEFKAGIEKEAKEIKISELKNQYSALLTKKEIDTCFSEDITPEDFEINLSLAYTNAKLKDSKVNKKSDFKVTDSNHKEKDDGLNIR